MAYGGVGFIRYVGAGDWFANLDLDIGFSGRGDYTPHWLYIRPLLQSLHAGRPQESPVALVLRFPRVLNTDQPLL